MEGLLERVQLLEEAGRRGVPVRPSHGGLWPHETSHEVPVKPSEG